MDTNVKSFKYSFFNKLICTFLCLITILSAAGITSFGIASISYCIEDIPESWTESYDFTNYFLNGVSNILNSVTSDAKIKVLREELKSQKSSIVQQALEKYETKYQELLAEAEKYGYDNVASYVYEYDNTDLEINVKTSLGTYTFSSSPYTETTYKNAEKYLSTSYDSFAETQNISDSYELYYNDYKILPVFYAKYGSSVAENLDSKDFAKENFTKNSIYFIYDNGEISYKGISKDLADSIYNDFIKNDKYAKDAALYTCIEDENINTVSAFLNNGGNVFYDLKQFHDKGVNFYNHIIAWGFFDLVLIIISFVCAFYFFSITGRKREGGDVKLAFIDYVPFEIHLGVYIGIAFGAAMLYINAIESLATPFSNLFVVFTVLLVFAIWLMLFEFSTSIARFAKSDKKFYKNFLVYLILYVLFIVIKTWIRLNAKLFRKIKARTKKTFSILFYKPHKFEQNVIALFILYCFANLIFFLLIVLSFAVYLPFIASVIILVDLAGNFIIMRKTLSYIKNLDTIIAASEKHEDVNLDIESLPKSLEILAQSMKYTNAELRDAVNQAVKDERLRTELITNVSHDLKTPLTSIITYVDLLSKCDINDEKAQEYIKVLDEKGARLKRLIDDLVEASKVTSGNIKFNPVQLNLSELCLQSTVDVQSDFEKAGLDLIIKQGEISPLIFADGPKTFRIIENLLSNARKYSAKGTRVYASVYKEDKYGVFEIKNISAQPLDISPDELTERFVRGDKSRNQEGNGLGLSIAKELCKAQKGELEISIDGDLFKAKVKLPLA